MLPKLSILQVIWVKLLKLNSLHKWWPDPESNWGHKDFQSSALPTELSGQTKVSY